MPTPVLFGISAAFGLVVATHRRVKNYANVGPASSLSRHHHNAHNSGLRDGADHVASGRPHKSNLMLAYLKMSCATSSRLRIEGR
jgi:hypothetical protein